MPGLPETSVITSWHGGSPATKQPSDRPLPGLTHALHSGLAVLDLYFLNESDIGWFLEQAGREAGWSAIQRQCPLSFAAALDGDEIRRIADSLLNHLIDEFGGRLIGPRPRIAALATYWPLITDDDSELRELSIRAVQNSLALAEHLGCHHVEIVGGAAFSDKVGKGARNKPQRDQAADQARITRQNRLCESLVQVFTDERAKSLGLDNGRAVLCLEMEPGSAFLLSDVESFHKVHLQLAGQAAPDIVERVRLNIDVAHMFLADAQKDDRQKPPPFAGADQLEYIIKHHLEPLIGHFHLSDHSRTHAADLCPGSYHFFEPDYLPWLKLAIQVTGQARFSNTVAVEMEACGEFHEVMRAVGRTLTWLHAAAADLPPGSGKVEGAILCVDVVNSTALLARAGIGLEKGAQRIDLAISSQCREIQRHRGAVYSFTGDGVVAVFDQRFFRDGSDCAAQAIVAADALFRDMRTKMGDEWKHEEEGHLALRISLHWGEVVIPSVGPLRNQVLGVDVILACRMLNVADPFDDSAQDKGTDLPVPSHRVNQVVSQSFAEHCPAVREPEWKRMDYAGLKLRFKGIHWTAFRDRGVNYLYLRRLSPTSAPSAP